MAAEQHINLEQLRNLVRQYIDTHLYSTAEFWANKVCSLSNNNMQDVLWHAQTLFLTGQYTRAGNILVRRNLTNQNVYARYLAAKCFYSARDFRLALNVIQAERNSLKGFCSFRGGEEIHSNISEEIINDGAVIDDGMLFKGGCIGSKKNVAASILLLKGKILEELENKESAIECYKAALQKDIFCFEAFDILVSHSALSVADENDLLNSLPYQQVSQEEKVLISFLYESRINKYQVPKAEAEVNNMLVPIIDNSDYIVAIAEKYFNNYDFKKAYSCASLVIKDDPLHEKCLPIYISCLFEQNRKNELYSFANKLVVTYPTNFISWYAIGVYYLAIGNNEMARKYFSKSTTLENNFGPAWLGFAHSFVGEGEHDQAIAAYCTAAKLMPGSHLPLLYLGIEYSLNNSTKLALKFLKDSLSISPNDPHIKHELGAFYYQSGDYHSAKLYLTQALDSISEMGSEMRNSIWEPLYNNLGHVSRKLKDFDSAIYYHEKALVISPKNHCALASLGLSLMLKGDIESAIPRLHQALSIQKEDSLTQQLLTDAFECLHLSQDILDLESTNDLTEDEISQENLSKSLSCVEMSLVDC